MFLELKEFLQPGEAAKLASLSRVLNFVDGRFSNPANTTKHNLQVDLSDPRYAESAEKQLTPFSNTNPSPGGRRSVAEGDSPNSFRYSMEKRPSSQKPYSVAISVTVVFAGSPSISAW